MLLFYMLTVSLQDGDFLVDDGDRGKENIVDGVESFAVARAHGSGRAQVMANGKCDLSSFVGGLVRGTKCCRSHGHEIVNRES